MAGIQELEPGTGAPLQRVGRARRGAHVRRPRPTPNGVGDKADKRRAARLDIIVGHPLHAIQNPLAYPWSAIVLLKILFASGRAGYGTGFFIAPSRIATAAHNLVHPQEGAAAGMDVLAGWNGAQALHRFSVVQKHVCTDWSYPWDEANDWAIVATDRPAPRELGYLGYQSYDQGYPAGLDIYVAGYPADDYGVVPAIGVAGLRHQCWDAGRIAGVTPVEIDYTMSTAAGMSGAPVFVWQDSVAIAVAIHTQGKGTTNGGRRIDDALQAMLSSRWR